MRVCARLDIDFVIHYVYVPKIPTAESLWKTVNGYETLENVTYKYIPFGLILHDFRTEKIAKTLFYL